MSNMTEATGRKNLKSMIKAANTKAVNNILCLLLILDDEHYQAALAVMEYIMLETPDTPDSPYHNLGILLGEAIENYERQHYPVPKASGVEVLSFLMEQHHLKQVDLAPVLGSPSLVSEVLSGKRELNKRQIEALSQHFKVSPAVFFG
jgi:HTH-type transcriptional regulator / antitoxin HigA